MSLSPGTRLGPFEILALLLLPFCAHSQSFTHGTAIAIVRTNAEIAVATDSRVVDESDTILDDICKIRKAGRWHFSLNGMASTGDANLFEIIGNLLQTTGDLASKEKAILNNVGPLLNTLVRSSDALRERLVKAGFVLGVTVYGYEKQPTLSFTRFMLSNKDVIKSTGGRCPGAVCPDGRIGVFVPLASAAKFDWTLEPIVAVRRFVQTEIERNDIGIGPPIQLFRITSNGRPEWIEKPMFCNGQE